MHEYVTERELQAHLGPINQKLDDVAVDVKHLLLVQAGDDAVARRRLRVSTRLLAWGAFFAGLTSPLLWHFLPFHS